MTQAQHELQSRLIAITDRRRWSHGNARIQITAGPRVFDVCCSDGVRTIWHWVGTADQIARALDNWIEQRQAHVLTRTGTSR
jgi:hypothetical protein